MEKSVAYEEEADWIVEEVRRQGVTLSRRKLADWHRAGLIPKPQRDFLGGPDGSESVYPRGTMRQAIECAVLMKRLGSVEHVGWELWMRGSDVAEHHWRKPLREAHEMFRLFLSTASNREDEYDDDAPEQSEAVDRLIETIGDQSETPTRMGVARRRLRRDGFKELLAIVTAAAIGAFKISRR